MKLVNSLTIVALLLGNYLAFNLYFQGLAVGFLNVIIVAIYFSSRVALNYHEKRYGRLNKEHGRLRLVYESEHRDTEILHVLDEISASFMEDKNLNTIFEHTLDGVQQVLKSDISVLEVTAEKDPTAAPIELVRGSEKFELDEGIYQKVLAQGNSILINNLSPQHTEYKKYRSICEQGAKSFLIAPLKIEKKSIGLLGTFMRDQYDFTGEELRLLTTFANHASLIIENARLLEITRQLAVTDELTQLYNFRHFKETFTREFRRARRYNHSLSLLMCDIDHFKNYNDTNGHEAGNEVLKKIAEIMRGSLRGVDFVARYGGEEFVIVLIETPKGRAVRFAERLRKKIEEEVFPFQEKQPKGNLTITIGIAGFPEDTAIAEELIDRADQALYRGKEGGRNRTEEY